MKLGGICGCSNGDGRPAAAAAAYEAAKSCVAGLANPLPGGNMCEGGLSRGSAVGFGFNVLLLPPPPLPDNDKAPPPAPGPSELNEEPPDPLNPGTLSGFCFA